MWTYKLCDASASEALFAHWAFRAWVSEWVSESTSVSGQFDDFLLYFFYRKKQIEDSCVCPVIDNEFLHEIVKVVCHSYFDNVMMKFMISNKTDAWKTDVNLLTSPKNSITWRTQENETYVAFVFKGKTHVPQSLVFIGKSPSITVTFSV